MGTVKHISPLKALLIQFFEILEMILNTLIIDGILRSAKAADMVLYRGRGRLRLPSEGWQRMQSSEAGWPRGYCGEP